MAIPTDSCAIPPHSSEWTPGAPIPEDRPAAANSLSTDLATRQAATTTLRTVGAIVVYGSFEEARPHWTSFEARADGYVYQCFEWLSLWHRHLGQRQGVEPCITGVVDQHGQLLMLLPLGLHRANGARRLIWLGGALSDYMGPLLDPNLGELVTRENFHALWRRVTASLPAHDLVDFERQPERIGNQFNPFCYLDVVPHASSAHATSLGRDYESFLLLKRSKKWLGGERRKERRLSEMGAVTCEMACDRPAIARRLEELMEHKSRWYRENGAGDLLAAPGYREFLRAISEDHIPTGMVQLSVIKLDDQTIAAMWGLLHRGRYYHILPAYASGETAKWSPGNMLLRWSFQRLIEMGADTFDFTLGDEPYKLEWCDQHLRLYDHLQPVTQRGWRAALPAWAKRWTRDRLRRWPSAWRLAKELGRRMKTR